MQVEGGECREVKDDAQPNLFDMGPQTMGHYGKHLQDKTEEKQAVDMGWHSTGQVMDQGR